MRQSPVSALEASFCRASAQVRAGPNVMSCSVRAATAVNSLKPRRLAIGLACAQTGVKQRVQLYQQVRAEQCTDARQRNAKLGQRQARLVDRLNLRRRPCHQQRGVHRSAQQEGPEHQLNDCKGQLARVPGGQVPAKEARDQITDAGVGLTSAPKTSSSGMVNSSPVSTRRACGVWKRPVSPVSESVPRGNVRSASESRTRRAARPRRQ